METETKPETFEQYQERTRFIRGAAVMLWCTESYNEPKRCWGDAQMLWDNKPEDC